MRIGSAKLRQQGYELMAKVFSLPKKDFTPEELLPHLIRLFRVWGTALGRLSQPREIPSLLQEASNTIHLLKEEEGKDWLLTLEITYNRLFYGPGQPLVPPYASAYLPPYGQLVMAQPAIEALRLYRSEGLIIDDTFYDLPDHLVLELEFMSFLCEQEEKTAAPEKCWEKQYQFLNHHLLWWCYPFVNLLQEHTSEPFYPLLARPLLHWIKSDEYYLGTRLNTNKNNPAEKEKDSLSGSYRTEGKTYNRTQVRAEEKFFLSLKGDCSFCGVCSLGCKYGALNLSLEEEVIVLSFYPARCSGCSICIETCPLKVLDLFTESGSSNGKGFPKEILAQSSYMKCRKCNEVITLPGQAYVFRQLKQEGEENLSLFLQLCEACRKQGLITRLTPASKGNHINFNL